MLCCHASTISFDSHGTAVVHVGLDHVLNEGDVGVRGETWWKWLAIRQQRMFDAWLLTRGRNTKDARNIDDGQVNLLLWLVYPRILHQS